jgi:hypothetical protein
MSEHADLFILYKREPTAFGRSTVILEMGGERDYNAKRRTFTVRASAVNYAKKHGALIAHVHFPAFGYPAVLEVIDPSAEES